LASVESACLAITRARAASISVSVLVAAPKSTLYALRPRRGDQRRRESAFASSRVALLRRLCCFPNGNVREPSTRSGLALAKATRQRRSIFLIYADIFPRGLDTSGKVDAGAIRTLGSVQSDSLASHSHPISDLSHAHSSNGVYVTQIGACIPSANYSPSGSACFASQPSTAPSFTGINHTEPFPIGSTEMRPANVSVNYIIKY